VRCSFHKVTNTEVNLHHRCMEPRAEYKETNCILQKFPISEKVFNKQAVLCPQPQCSNFRLSILHLNQTELHFNAITIKEHVNLETTRLKRRNSCNITHMVFNLHFYIHNRESQRILIIRIWLVFFQHHAIITKSCHCA
jgi:hypothetical protein